MEAKLLKISPQGQITLPKKWREKLTTNKINEVYVEYDVEAKTVKIDTIPQTKEEWINSLRGIMKQDGVDAQEYINKIRDEWDDK